MRQKVPTLVHISLQKTTTTTTLYCHNITITHVTVFI